LAAVVVVVVAGIHSQLELEHPLEVMEALAVAAVV
jgi:pseudouridine-5'-phosphate glycosidase